MSAMPAPRAGRRARLSMAEQLADNRQSEPGARAPALVRVPQVVATACHGRFRSCRGCFLGAGRLPKVVDPHCAARTAPFKFCG